MRRRSVLATLAVAPVAGCGTRLPPFARPPSSPGSTTVPSLDDLPCPPESVDPAAAVCAHRADDPPVVVRATERVASLGTTTRFVLTNATGARLRFNPHNPDVYRYVGGSGDEYDLVERQPSGNGVVEVPPGGEHEWRLADLPQGDRLSPGTFLFGVSVPTAGTMDVEWVTCLAPFRLTDG